MKRQLTSLAVHRYISLGLNINVLDHPMLLQTMPFPEDANQTCEDWDAWTKTHVVDQTDAGP